MVNLITHSTYDPSCKLETPANIQVEQGKKTPVQFKLTCPTDHTPAVIMSLAYKVSTTEKSPKKTPENIYQRIEKEISGMHPTYQIKFEIDLEKPNEEINKLKVELASTIEINHLQVALAHTIGKKIISQSVIKISVNERNQFTMPNMIDLLAKN